MSNESVFGGVYSATKKSGLKVFDEFPSSICCNIAQLYSFVTAMLGFIPGRHEGKITGLAAFGRPSLELEVLLLEKLKSGEIQAALCWENVYSDLIPAKICPDEKFFSEVTNDIGKKFSREDIAATIQHIAESHIIEILDSIKQASQLGANICLAGGLFANVKINQKVKQLTQKRVFVFPPMTDEGAAIGAAWHVLSKKGDIKKADFNNPYLGDECLNARSALHKNHIQTKDFGSQFMRSIEVWISKFKILPKRNNKRLIRHIASLLAEGKVVAIMRGRCEFGPRALGNRSILATAENKTINIEINNRLKRTEFMPFAPVARYEDAAELFGIHGLDRLDYRFMTITTNCTEVMGRLYPAVVHIDNTARPQLVQPDSNPFLYQLLGEYYALTGKKVLINTSFNVHEEPIVCNIEDALKGFFSTGLDYICIDDILVDLNANKEVQDKYLKKLNLIQ
jgi:carbamoyltransferase